MVKNIQKILNYTLRHSKCFYIKNYVSKYRLYLQKKDEETYKFCAQIIYSIKKSLNLIGQSKSIPYFYWVIRKMNF
jgi:hypothetical protein